jgi:hypothetical protein
MRLLPVNLKATLLWLTDATTECCNGFLRGLLPGTGVGGVAVAQTDTTDVSTLSWAGFGGVFVTAMSNGIVHVVVWHRTNPIPNPFRRSDQMLLPIRNSSST